MERKSLKVKAHFFALTSVLLLFLDSFFGFLIYDGVKHSPTQPTFLSSNPNDIMATWFPCGLAALTFLCMALAVVYFLHEQEKSAIWISEDKWTGALQRLFLFVFLFNLPIFSLWHSNPALSIILHIVLLFAEGFILSVLQQIKRRRAA